MPGGLLDVGLWLGLGAAIGAIVQRSHFCIMGALADLLVMRSRQRLCAWAAAVAAAAGTVALAPLLGAPGPAGPAPSWGAALAGGIGFGFGMVLAGGCLLRNLVRLGAGSLRAVLVLTLALGSGLAVTALGPPPHLPTAAGTGPLPQLAIAVAGLALALAGNGRARARGELAGGLALGALAGLALVLPGLGGGGVNAWAALAALPGWGAPGTAVAALVPGLILGAALAARHAGTWRLERFVDRADRRRHVVGALLMGAGAALAGGCSFAHGIGGLAIAAPGSLLVVVGLVAGAAWALRFLETGGLLAGFRALFRFRDA